MKGWKKVNLYKFTHTLLLKNDGQLKQKKWQTKKKNHPIYQKIKRMSQKKLGLVKKKKKRK